MSTQTGRVRDALVAAARLPLADLRVEQVVLAVAAAAVALVGAAHGEDMDVMVGMLVCWRGSRGRLAGCMVTSC